MPDTAEDSAVLDLDSGNTLVAIQHALEAFSRTIPGAAVPKVTFEQKPDVEEGGIWMAGVTLQCLGGLEPTGEAKEDQSFLANVAPEIVHQQTWTAKGFGFASAVEELRDVVEGHLEGFSMLRQQDLQVVSAALRSLRNPNELNNVWATTDNPEDEHAPEEEQ